MKFTLCSPREFVIFSWHLGGFNNSCGELCSIFKSNGYRCLKDIDLSSFFISYVKVSP